MIGEDKVCLLSTCARILSAGVVQALQPSKFFIVTFALFSNGEVRDRRAFPLSRIRLTVSLNCEVFIAIEYGKVQPLVLSASA